MPLRCSGGMPPLARKNRRNAHFAGQSAVEPICGGRDERANVVVEHVVAHAEATANRRIAAGARRISEADARHEVCFRRLRRTKSDQTRAHSKCRSALAASSHKGTGTVFIPQPDVQTQIRPDLPDIVPIPPDACLVT